MIDTLSFYQKLLSLNFDYFTGVPDSLLKELCSCIKENSPNSHNIIAANEGNAVALAAGHYLGSGNPGVVYMQNSGEGNTVNPLLSLADEDVYSIPMLLIIGWRGEPGKHDEPQHVKQGKVTLSLLEAMGIKYEILTDDYESALQNAKKYFDEYSRPYALVIQKGTFSPYKSSKLVSPYSMLREEALEVIINELDENDLIVSTTGKTSREIFEIRERRNENHDKDFLTVGSMGHTASIAYGLAGATKNNVYCLDGDGSFLMHMGGIGVIGSRLLNNFKYVLNDNNAHESVGGQPTCTPSLDIPAILKACGFKHVFVANNKEELVKEMKNLKDTDFSALIIHTKPGSRDDLGRPTTTPIQNKDALMKFIGSKK